MCPREVIDYGACIPKVSPRVMLPSSNDPLFSHSRAVGPLVCSSHLTAPQGISTWISRSSMERRGRHHPSVAQFRETAFYGPNMHHFSHVRLCTLSTVARQAPLSMGFPRQEYWSGFPSPSAGDLPNTGMKG